MNMKSPGVYLNFNSPRTIGCGSNGNGSDPGDNDCIWTWTEFTNDMPNALFYYYYNNDWIAVGPNSKIFKSNHFSIWNEYEVSESIDFIKVLSNGDLWIAIGGPSAGNKLYGSTDKETWTKIENSPTGSAYDIAYDGTNWMVSGSFGLYRSSDGYNWTQIAQDITGINNIAVHDGLWMITAAKEAGQSDMTIYTSDDFGESWVKRSIVDAPAFIMRIATNGDAWVALTEEENGGYVLSTDDGETWTHHSFPEGGLKRQWEWPMYLESAGGRFIGLYSSGIVFSENGIDWDILDFGIEDPWFEGIGIDPINQRLLVYEWGDIRRLFLYECIAGGEGER